MEKTNRISLFRSLLLLILVLYMALPCGTVWGQDTTREATEDSDEFTLPEIIVTSEFREKSIQRTPLAISAVGAETIESRSQISLDQIALQAPNVSLKPNTASGGSAMIAYIRGIGQTDFNPSVEPGVAIYVDDVYYSTITGNLLDLLDLERVEVLRGPQGTLAGRNAIGGAIKLFTRKADGSDDGYASVTVGDSKRLDAKAAAGFEIIPQTLFMRVAGVSRSQKGYVTRLDYACVKNLPTPGNPGGLPTYIPVGSQGCKLGTEGGKSMTAGRLSLRWLPTDKFEVSLASNIVRDKSEGQPSILIAAKDNGNSSIFDPNSGSLVPIFFDNDGDRVYTPGTDVAYDSRFAMPGTYKNYATYLDDGRSTPSPMFQGAPGQDVNVYKPAVVPPVNHLDSYDLTLNINWTLSDNTSLLSVTSYREYTNVFGEDTDGSPLALQQLLQKMWHEQWTQELRLNTSLFDEFADLTIGGFYIDQETNESARVTLNYAAFDFLHGPDKVPAKSKAAYGQLVLHLTDKMNLTLGLRYSKDEKSYTFARHNPDMTPVGAPVSPFFFAGNPSNSGVYGLNGTGVSYSSDRFDYRVALDYTFNDNLMVYGQVATGYKAGGNNARPFFPSQINAFDPEELTAYEVGMKSTLFDNFRLNASAFFNDYTNIQLPSILCTWAPEGEQVPCASQNNVGDSEIRGFELEGMWAPTRELSVDFSYSYLNFEYTSILAGASSVTLDMVTPYTPENKWSLGAQYSIKLGKNMGNLTPRVDVSYQDDIYTNATNDPRNRIDAYTVANARLTWQSENQKTEISLECTNLTDKYYYYTLFDSWEGAGYVSGQPARPREYAVTIKRMWF